VPASGEFRLSITRALTDQLISSLAELDPEPLTEAAALAMDHKPGIYQLFLNGSLVYVGKADRAVPTRLLRHYRKLAGRANIDLTAVSYCALSVYEDLQAVAPETLLIKHFRSQAGVPWNFNGFGSNDPGQNRDQTVFEGDHFDVRYPARLDWRCASIAAGHYKAADLASALKADLPYVFRYQSAPILAEAEVEVPTDGMIADELFGSLAVAIQQHNAAWRVVALPGYAIMYPKAGAYPSAQKIY